MRRHLIIVISVAVMAASGGYFLAMVLSPQVGGPAPVSFQPANPVRPPAAEDLIGQPRPAFSLRDMDGRPVSADDFDGRPWLVNFWATWCKPCVEEMPMLSQLQAEFTPTGLRVVGIALDDPERAREFAQSLGISYPVLVGQADVVVTGRQYGNQAGLLPYSVLIDDTGRIRWTHLGALERDELIKQVDKITDSL